jgi:hypothetical protein
VLRHKFYRADSVIFLVTVESKHFIEVLYYVWYEASVTEDEKTNEHLKLTGNLFNALAVAVLAAGCFVPTAQFVYGFLPQTVSPWSVYAGGIVCFVFASILHIAGQLFVGGLR